MASTTPKSAARGSAFWKGFRDALPFIFVAGPFAMLFGVLATEAGLNVVQTLSFSFVVVAGAAQFTALQLMLENVPTIIVLASALAVNLRMAMYSASLTPYLGQAPLWQRALMSYVLVDQAYACSVAEFEQNTRMTLPERVAYFFGTVAPVLVIWYVFTGIGAVVGTRIPDSWALDFALPIAFLAMVAPMLRTPAHIVAAFVSVVVSLLAAGVPYSLGLIIAGICAMIAGAQTEVWLARRKSSL